MSQSQSHRQPKFFFAILVFSEENCHVYKFWWWVAQNIQHISISVNLVLPERHISKCHFWYIGILTTLSLKYLLKICNIWRLLAIGSVLYVSSCQLQVARQARRRLSSVTASDVTVTVTQTETNSHSHRQTVTDTGDRHRHSHRKTDTDTVTPSSWTQWNTKRGKKIPPPP